MENNDIFCHLKFGASILIIYLIFDIALFPEAESSLLDSSMLISSNLTTLDSKFITLGALA